MLSYVLRRLILMIPTLVGILILNFVVIRLENVSLTQAMQQQTNDKAGDASGRGMRTESSYQSIENYIARFWRSGDNLPSIVNLRGFLTKADLVASLKIVSDHSGNGGKGSMAELSRLWLLGHFAVDPLAQVLQDDSLSALHGQASVALVFCAYLPLNIEDLSRLSDARIDHVRLRNSEMKDLFFADGTADPKYASKRAALLAIVARDHAEFSPSTETRWAAILGETGFVDFMRKLFTGTLYSESRGDYVFHVIAERWYVTFWLNFTAIALSWFLSILIGIRAARVNGSLEERATTQSLFLLWSIPSFFAGTLLLHHFCTSGPNGHALFPNRGLSSEGSLWLTTPAYICDVLWHAALPLLVLTYSSFTSLSRYMRANLLEQLSSDYTRSARAKGCSEDAVVYNHALPNSLITQITLGSSLLADLFGSSVIVETIFSISGLGWLLFDAARQLDGPLVMGSTVISVLLLLIGILIADLLYAVVDPRIRAKYV